MDGGQVTSVVIVAILTFGVSICMIARAFSARARAKLTAPPELKGLETRLERIEQSVDSIAVEIERVSEAQRFTARLMSERREAIPMPVRPAEDRR